MGDDLVRCKRISHEAHCPSWFRVSIYYPAALANPNLIRHIAGMEVGGRIVRLLTKHEAGDRYIEQWFLVGVDDDEKALNALSKHTRSEEQVVEVAGIITTALASRWNLRAAEVRLVLPGEPIES